MSNNYARRNGRFGGLLSCAAVLVIYAVLFARALERVHRADWPVFMPTLAALSMLAFVMTLLALRIYTDKVEEGPSVAKAPALVGALATAGALVGGHIFYSVSRSATSYAFFAVLTSAVLALAFRAHGLVRPGRTPDAG